MNKKKQLLFFFTVCITLLSAGCKNENSTNKSSEDNTLKGITKQNDSIISNQKKLGNEKEAIIINYDSVITQLEPDLITIEEFNNFKKKSNYIQAIQDYDEKNPSELLGGKENQDQIRYYHTPTEINTKKYLSNSILFGDLNQDEKRDCIIITYRSDMYNEVAFFYVFINYGNTFKLEDVKTEDDICGCKKEVWPNLFRYQKIEDGFLKGISMCHYEDAHCCPAMIFQTKVKFIKGELKFQSTEFIKDEYPYDRDIPILDSVIVHQNF